MSGPWQCRQCAWRGRWAPASPGNNPTATGCVIRDNISSKGERIYHVPGGQYYDATIIDTGKGERGFCGGAEAGAAWWRKSKL
jgi:micrococcal nuclease